MSADTDSSCGTRLAYMTLEIPAATDSAYSSPNGDVPLVTTSKPGVWVAPGSTIGMSRVCRRSCDGRTATPPSSVPFATASLTDCWVGSVVTVTFFGSWLAASAAVSVWGEAPATPMWTGATLAPPAKDSPRTADMSSGAARHPMRTERSRRRRWSSFHAMTRINPEALSR